MDLGKWLRDRKDQAVRQWQDSVVLDAVSSGTKADNARRQVVADKERALDVGRSQAVKFQGQQFREGKIDRDKLLSNINSIVGFDTLEDQGLRKQGDLYFNTQKDNNVNTFLNNAGSAIMNAAPQRVIGGAAEYGGTLIGNEDIRDFGQKISQPYRDFGAAAQENAGNKVVATGSQVVGNLLTLPLNPAGKVGMATRFATAALPRAADTSFAIRQGGGSENAQKIGGGAVGAVSGVMNTLGGEKVLKPFTGVASKAANPLTKLLTTKLAPRVAGRVLAAGNMEGLEEVTETGVENLVAQKTFDPNRKLTDNLAQSYVLGAGMGSAVRGGVELGSMRSSTTPTQLTPEVQNKRNNLANAYTTLVDQGRPDQAAYFAREIDQIDNPAPGTLRERIRSAKDMIMPKGEGGYAKNPFYRGDDVAGGLSKEQSEFINDYANMLEGMGAGNGVDITPDGRRISNNVRDASTAGKTMTKQDWFDKARKDIESGKAGFGASDEYKKLTGAKPVKPKNTEKPKPVKSDPLESLKAEARKYKSADEFVKAKTNAYRATSEAYDPTKVSLSGRKQQFGTYVTNDLETAKAYLDNRNTMIDNLHLPSSARIATEKDLPKSFQVNELSDFKKFGGPQEWQQEAAKWAKKNGYDAMDFGGGNNVTVVNPEALKTANQLKALWSDANNNNQGVRDSLADGLPNPGRKPIIPDANQATKPKAYYQNVPKSYTEPRAKSEVELNTKRLNLTPEQASQLDPLESLKQEARKYKSAEEFRKNLLYNDDIILHQTGKNTADKINKEGFKSGKETGLGEKRSEVYGMSAYDWMNHKKFSKDTYARDGSDVAEVAIDTKGLKIIDRSKQKFTDEEYVKGIHKQIPEGYDGVKVGYGNGVNEVLLKPEVANARRFNIDDLYTQSQPPKSPIESLKQEATPKYMQDKVTPEGYFTEGRYKDSAYPKNFVAKADIPHTGIKAGDRVALIKGRDGRFDAILSKKYKEKSTGYTISRESFVDPKSFTSSTKGTSPELVPTPVKQTAKGNNTPIKGTQSQPPKSPIESLKQEARKYKSAEEFVRKDKVASKTTHTSGGTKEGNPQSVKIVGDKIVVTNRRHRKVIGKYELPLSEWENLQKSFGNPNYNIKQRIKAINQERFPQNYEDIYNSSFIDRLEDNQISAIKSAYEAHTKRQQLTDLYNQATQSQPPKSPLTVEKNTELKQTFYKGFKKDGTSTGSGQGDAFYMSPYENIAKTYDEGAGVKSYKLADDVKAIDWKDPTYKAVQEKHMVQVPGGEPGYRKPDYNAINKELRSMGYDVVTSKNPDGTMPQVAVINQKKVIEIKKQSGVHDSLADNLPNQTDRKQADNVFSLTQQSPVSKNIISQSVKKPTLQDALEGKSTKPFTPISQPVDNIPAVVKQVTKKQTSEQKIVPPVVAPAVQKQTPAPRPTKTTKPKSPERLVVGGKSAEVSSDGRIANIDEFVKQQVAEQEAEPEKTGRISKLKRVWIDTLSPAEDNFRQAVKDGKLSQETLDDIIVKNGKSIRSGTAANINLVESGLVDLLHNKSKEDYDNLGQTLIAIHAKDLRANGIETGRDAALDEQIVAKYGEQFKADIEQFRDAANYVLDKSVASQLISKETADMLKKKYPNYVPMNRVMEELENTGSFNSSQIASIGKQTVVRKIKGSKRTVENPLESMISKVQDMTKQSLKNEAAITWVDALKKTGDAKLIEGTVKPGESTISVIRNGNKEIYSVEPEMEAAAKGLTKEQMGTITNAARKVSRVFKTGTTGLNLPFIVTNLARDQQNALLNQSKGELETFKAIPTAIMETLGHGKLYQEAVRNGAISTSFDLTKPNLKLTAANIRKRGSSLGALSKIEDVIGRSEEYTRIQQYKATKEYWLEQGMSESQAQNKATIAAQQNSADFARAGDLGQILNAWLPYTNAGVQGTRSTLRAAKNNPVRYATKAGAMLVMPTIMTALWNTGDEERKKIYDDISENDKQASFIVITPWAKKNEEGKWEGIVKIPKPPGISALLYPVEKGVASMNGLDPVGFKDIVKGVLGFGSPLGDNLNAAVSTVTPQAIKPAVEATINRNLFTNRDIVPYWLKDKPANEQAYKGSSGTARMISSLTGVSPIKVEHMIRGYGGELGLQGLNAADNALNKAGLIPKEQIGGISIPAGFKKRFTEAYDKPGSTIQRGTGAGASATAAKNYEDAVAGIKSSYGGKYAELTEEEVKELGKTDADAKDYYKTLQAVKQSSKTPDELPTNLNPLATSIYEKEARLTTDGKDKWNKRPSANKEVNNTIKSWLPKGVDAPRITNETTKKWADYEKKKAEGTLGKLEEESAKKTILRSAYNSVLTEDEKDLYTLSKDKLLDAYDRGVINDQNIDKALKVERQLFDAGLISTETLAKKLGLVARGYKGRSGGRGGRGGSGKIAKDTSVAFSNALQSTTLKRLNSLLAGTQSGGSTSRRVATSKPVLKKISVKA